MAQSQINRIVTEHGIKPGEPMRNVHGEVIEGSCVLSPYMFIHREDGPTGGYRLISENALLGDQHQEWISADTLAALRGYAG